MVHQDQFESSFSEDYAMAPLSGARIFSEKGEPESLVGARHGPIMSSSAWTSGRSKSPVAHFIGATTKKHNQLNTLNLT
jgi:hypothetical protein